MTRTGLLLLLVSTLSFAGTAHANRGKAKQTRKKAPVTKVKAAEPPAGSAAAEAPALSTARQPAKKAAASESDTARKPAATTGTTKVETPAARVSDSLGALLDQLAMLQFGNGGSSQAHLFIEDTARYSGGGRTTAESRLWSIRGSFRKFRGPKKDGSIIVMFGDRSGAYIHPDGFVTPMGADISHEVGQWEELKD
jgi:hypothetical protein